MKRLMMGLLFLVVQSGTSVHASKEDILTLSSFTIESAGIGASGPVRVTGSQDTKGITTIRINAFEKEFIPSEAQLSSLRDLTANGIQLSYEAGYNELGGRTIYLIFSKGFTSGKEQTQLVVLKENGQITVTDGRNHIRMDEKKILP
jgi:hypothetical protein